MKLVNNITGRYEQTIKQESPPDRKVRFGARLDVEGLQVRMGGIVCWRKQLELRCESEVGGSALNND